MIKIGFLKNDAVSYANALVSQSRHDVRLERSAFDAEIGNSFCSIETALFHDYYLQYCD